MRSMKVTAVALEHPDWFQPGVRCTPPAAGRPRGLQDGMLELVAQ